MSYPGNMVNNITGQLTETGSGGGFVAAEVETNVDRIRICNVGDSVTNGTGATVSFNGFVGALPASINEVNLGFPSKKTIYQEENIENYLGTFNPSIVAYAPFSVNDGTPTTETIHAQLCRFIRIKEICRRNGVVLIPEVLAPVNSQTLDTYNLMMGLFSEITAKGFSLIDLKAALSNGGTPEGFISGASSDGIHPNDTGYSLMISRYSSEINRIGINKILYPL